MLKRKRLNSRSIAEAMMMRFIKKELSLEHNKEVMDELLSRETKTPATVSLRKFIDVNFETFKRSGKTTREIYEFLQEKNFDVSTFQVFTTLYSKVKKDRSQISAASTQSPAQEEFPKNVKEQEPLTPEGTQSIQERGESKECKGKPIQNKMILPPVLLPGGVEASIDLETGAKSFDIRSERE